MPQLSRRHGLTLLEILIVVVILATLAAVILPQFADTAKSAREGALALQLRSLRSVIELYRQQHLGGLPTVQGGTLPQLLASTDVNGVIGPRGAGFPYGPYMLDDFPRNPVTEVNTVTATASFPPLSASGNNGWLYHEATGQFAADVAEYLAY